MNSGQYKQGVQTVTKQGIIMSADLFAAFGPDASSHTASKGKQEEDRAPATKSHVLVPVIEDLETEHQDDLYQNPSRPEKENRTLLRHDDGGADVLFDATDDVHETDEDFGDFEDANAVGRNTTASPIVTHLKQESMNCIPGQSRPPIDDLLGLDQEYTNTMGSTVTPTPRPTVLNTLSTSNAQGEPSTTSAEDDWGDFSAPTADDMSQATRVPTTKPQRITTQMSEAEQGTTEDVWDPFEDGEPASSTHTQTNSQPTTLIAPPAAAVPRAQRSTGTTPLIQGAEIRPSNIPPPATMLQLLPGVFDDLRQTVSQKGKETLDKTTKVPSQDVALNLIQTFTVAARIIAGRSLRWKRDAILAQSMRIGPAASAGGGRGMKLAAIDKSESLKEEKEAADVVGAWEKSAHLFNSTVSKAGIQRPLMALYLSVRPRLVSGVDVLKASHACVLCGINRDERVPQVEVKVEDSFGEYWREHWGHRDCRDFWTRYKDRLQQR